MYGEIPYIPIDEQPESYNVSDNYTYTVTARLVAPFRCLEITGEPKFADLQPNGHVYVSPQPLYDDNFYIMVVIANNMIDLSQSDNPYYDQGQYMQAAAQPSIFYLTKVRKPFSLMGVHLDLRYPFYTYPSRQTRTGKLVGTSLSPDTNQTSLITLDDTNPDEPFTQNDLDNLYWTTRAELAGATINDIDNLTRKRGRK